MLHTPHRDTGSSRFCGPTAIMCVTGERGSRVARLVRDVKTARRGKSSNATGLLDEDLLTVMRELGWAPVEEWSAPLGADAFIVDPRGRVFNAKGERGRFAPRYRFAQFLADRGAGGPYIVGVTGHYLAVSHGEICDAASTVLPTDIDRYLTRGKFGCRQSWVTGWWRFERIMPVAEITS